MKPSEELFDLIEGYLAGSLQGTVLKKFEEELKTNKALAEEVALHKEMSLLLDDTSEEAAFRKNLKRIGASKDLEKGFQKNYSKLYFWLMISAIIAILSFLYSYYF